MGKLKKSLVTSKVPNSSDCSNDKSFQDMKKELVEFFNLLGKLQQNSNSLSSRKEKNEVLFLLFQLKKQLAHSISNLNVPVTIEKQEFFCGICSGKIILEPLQEIWECLDDHCHLKNNRTTNFDHKKDTNVESISNIELESCSDSESSTKEEIECTEDVGDSSSESSSKGINQGENDFMEESDNIGEHDATNSTIVEDLSLTPSSNSRHTMNSSVLKSRSWYPASLRGSFEENNQSDETKDKKTENEDSLCAPSVHSKFIKIANLHSNAEGSIQGMTSQNNGFLFNFKPKYSRKEESLLYPRFYHKFDLEGDPILQKTGPDRLVCLACCCEMLGPSYPSSIMSHVSGSKHCQTVANPAMKSIISKYHETFLRLDRQYQSHQIYFATDNTGYLVKCVVCLKYVKREDVEAHILSDLHKNQLILMSGEKKLHSIFYFLAQHVEGYGIKCDASKIKNGLKEVTRPRRYASKKQHNIVKSIDESGSLLKNKLPPRFSKQFGHLKVMGDSIMCTMCHKINNKTESIRLHLVQPSHLELTKTQTLNYIYHCDVCDQRFHDEMAWILHFEDEEYKRHKEISEFGKADKYAEYECSTCKLVLFGDSDALEKHRKSNPIRRNERPQTVSLNKEVKEFFCSKTSLGINGDKLLADAEDVVSNSDVVIKCCEDLENALKIKYASCKAHPFGSRVSGLGCSESDLDIFIDIGSMYTGNQKQDDHNQTLIISTVLNLMRKKKEFTQINSIPTARTPIIQLKHKSTKLDCDISFVHGLSVENTKFLRYCFELQPISQKLILIVKKWSHLCKLNENITTYALAMMGIFYLQKKNYLLSVDKLKELNKKNLTIVGWETIEYVTPKTEILKNIEAFDGGIIELLTGFFKFYSNFNYKLNVVCPLLGKEIPKDLFSIDPKGSALPKEMSSYVKKINNESSPEYFRCLSQFCIQDPFDLSHNLTKACSSVILNKFVKLCNLTYEMLTKLED